VSESGGAAPAFIAPGATLGVLGGGQLGRMFAHAAQRSGYAVAVLDPDPASPAGRVAEQHIEAGYLDRGGLARLADASAAITTIAATTTAASVPTAGRRVARAELTSPPEPTSVKLLGESTGTLL